MKTNHTPLGIHREKRFGWDQGQMAAILRTSQPEVSRTENGDLPPNKKELTRWAHAYHLSVKAFKRMCEEATAAKVQKEIDKWDMPLWRYSEAKTPAEIQTIDCRSVAKPHTNCA